MPADVMPDPDYFDCGLDGRENDPVKIGSFNRLLRVIGKHHLSPLKLAAATMKDHVEECALLQAKIAGGIRVLIWMVTALTSVIGLAATMYAKKQGWL